MSQNIYDDPEQASSDSTNVEVDYRQADLEDVEIDADSIDLAYSSLTLHYVADLARLTRTILNTLIKAGFQIAHVEEWSPNNHQLAEHPEWANERHRPPFLLVACAKDSVGA